MSQESSLGTERVVVQTYVPEYQRDYWDEHAEELDMNRSEFIRTMVQAGRQVYTDEDSLVAPSSGDETSGESAPSNGTGVNQSTDSLTETVTQHLTTESCLDWDDLLAEVSGDIETRLEDALETLQADNRIKYSGREGGYVLQEVADE